jgi:hypothetical protein
MTATPYVVIAERPSFTSHGEEIFLADDGNDVNRGDIVTVAEFVTDRDGDVFIELADDDVTYINAKQIVSMDNLLAAYDATLATVTVVAEPVEDLRTTGKSIDTWALRSTLGDFGIEPVLIDSIVAVSIAKSLDIL